MLIGNGEAKCCTSTTPLSKTPHWGDNPVHKQTRTLRVGFLNINSFPSNPLNPKNTLISNVTSQEVKDASLLKELLVKQIESRVRWRENVNFMLSQKINNFIEIGPGKVLSSLIKRIDKNVFTNSVNTEEDIKKININD